MEVEEDTDGSLERSTLTIPAEGQLQRGARMVVRFFVVSFITWVKDQPIGASEKASRAAGGLVSLSLSTGCVYAPCCCTFRSRSHPSDFTITRTESSRLPNVLCGRRQGSRWCILEGCTLT